MREGSNGDEHIKDVFGSQLADEFRLFEQRTRQSRPSKVVDGNAHLKSRLLYRLGRVVRRDCPIFNVCQISKDVENQTDYIFVSFGSFSRKHEAYVVEESRIR